MISSKGRILLFLGEEEFSKYETIKNLRSFYEKKGGVIYYSFSITDNDFSMEDVIRLAQTSNLFLSHQIIVLRDIEKIGPRDSEILLAYVKNPPEFTDLFLLSRLKKNKIDSKLEWLNLVLRHPSVETKEFFPLKNGELRRWIIKEVNKREKEISSEGINFLISRLGNNLFSLFHTIEKVALYTRERKIDLADLEKLTGRDISLDIYKMFNAILDRDLKKGLRILRDMEELNINPGKILSIWVRELRKFYLAKKLQKKGLTEAEIKRELEINYSDIFFHNLKKLTLEEIRMHLRHLIYVEESIKKGKRKPFPTIEFWLLEIFR